MCLAYVHPVATVFSAVPVAMMDTVNATARTEEKEEGYECIYYLSQITPDRYVTFDNNAIIRVNSLDG